LVVNLNSAGMMIEARSIITALRMSGLNTLQPLRRH
jgi:hypothetical protein